VDARQVEFCRFWIRKELFWDGVVGMAVLSVSLRISGKEGEWRVRKYREGLALGVGGAMVRAKEADRETKEVEGMGGSNKIRRQGRRGREEPIKR
jgi:hypothetical protein